MLSLYALLIWRGLRILTISKNLFGVLIAGGIVAMMLFQVFVNVGMTVGIMPITGIPLPLMSYGGSSILSTMLADRPAAIDLFAGPLGSGVEGTGAHLPMTRSSDLTTSTRDGAGIPAFQAHSIPKDH